MSLLEILIPAAYAAFFIFIIKKAKFFQTKELSRNTLIYIFLLKLIFGIAVYLIYTQHYTYRNTSDAFRYYDDGVIMAKALKSNPSDYFKMLTGIQSHEEHLKKYYMEMTSWYKGYNYHLYNDNRTIIRFNALIYPLSLGIYHVHTVFICFLSFIGLLGIYKVFEKYVFNKSMQLILAIFLVPSILFWGSGVLKEGLILFAFGVLFFSINRILTEKRNLKTILAISFCIIILLLSKFYVFIAALPGFLAWVWFSFSSKNVLLKHFLTITGFVLLSWMMSGFSDKTNAFKIFSDKQKDFLNLARGGTYLINIETKDTFYVNTENKEKIIKADTHYKISPSVKIYQSEDGFLTDSAVSSENDQYRLLFALEQAGSLINIQRLEPNMQSVLKASPQALINTIARPHLFEANSLFMLIAAFENILIICLILLSIVFFKKPSVQNLNLWCFCISFTIILATLIGLITPVLGATVRYKVPLIPFLISGCILVFDHEKFERIFRKRTTKSTD